MNIIGLLHRSAHAYPEAAAVSLGARGLYSYADLAERGAKLAAGQLARFGLEPGDRVGIVQSNTPAYLECLAAVWHAGLVAVPMNAKLHAREFVFMLERSGAKLCLAGATYAEGIARAGNRLGQLHLIDVEGSDYRRLFDRDAMAPVPRRWDDLAWLFFTSGTTGQPKGAMLTHGNLLTMTACFFADVDAIGMQDGLLHAAPMSHGSGIYILPYWAAAGRQIVPESAGFDPVEITALCQAESKIGAFFAPTMAKRLVDHAESTGARLPGLKSIIYGGGPMYQADLRRGLEILGQVFVQIYGQGESPMCITALSRADHLPPREDDPDAQARYARRLASVGKAQLLCEVMVADAEGRALPPGEPGEVLVRGPSVMAGYWNDPEATAKTLAGGWLHSGDVGTMDADGYLTLTDRSKDVIISGGSNIYPREVEEVLLRHPAVSECSVIGQPDPEWGEVVVAFVVSPRGEATAEALDALCLEEIARFKRPKHYRFVESLPKNSYGKILKTELRKSL